MRYNSNFVNLTLSVKAIEGFRYTIMNPFALP